MPELSIPQANDPEQSAPQRGGIIVVVGSAGEGSESAQEFIAQVTESTARPITAVANFYEAIGELTTTKMRHAPDAVIASVATFGSRLEEFSLALRKTDPAVTILAVARDGLAVDTDLAAHVDAVLTLPLNRLELERAIQTADMVARQTGVADPDPEESAGLEAVVEEMIESESGEVAGEESSPTTLNAVDAGEVRVVQPMAGEGAGRGGLLADHDLLEQLLQSPTLPAVAATLELQLMSFYKDVEVRIIFAASTLEDPHTTPILYQGRLLALLQADKIDSTERQIHADWAAPYLALTQQMMTYREMAYTDDLTGAHNRRYFNLVLPQAIETARPRRECVTLLLFDIDDFKKFNDEFGHTAGDRILTETVSLLKSVIRPTDQVCRLGGDEFAVIFFDAAGSRTPGSNHPHDIMAIAQRFQTQIAAQRFPELGQKAPGKLTISGGLATFPWDAHDAASLYEFADRAALAAKRSGKNVITFG